MTLPRPSQGWFAIRGLALATVNPSAKFDVFISTHYKHMKSNTDTRRQHIPR